MKKDTYIRIRLSKDEKEMIKRIASKENKNMSKLILDILKDYYLKRI